MADFLKLKKWVRTEKSKTQGFIFFPQGLKSDYHISISPLFSSILPDLKQEKDTFSATKQKRQEYQGFSAEKLLPGEQRAR